MLGTRPEAIKLAGVVDLLGPTAWVIHTGQHYDAALGSDVWASLGLPPPDDELGVGGARRGSQLGHALSRLDELFSRHRPSVVVVQGDTNATVAGALAANAAEVGLVHVEAGLRSHDRAMPEEHNRIVTDHLADMCCAPTPESVANLAAEGIDGDRVALTGNTVVESVRRLLPASSARQAMLLQLALPADGYVVATFHRPENVDRPDTLAAILTELASLPLPVVIPLHPRSVAMVTAFGLGELLGGLRVVAPMPPRQFLGLAAEAALLISDSGGIQEEASVLKRPVLVVRRSTERPEVLGTFAELVGPEGLREGALAWLGDPSRVNHLKEIPSPYGDGGASAAIVALLTDRWAPGDDRGRRAPSAGATD